MTEFVHLIGSEKVGQAGNDMRAAAQQMVNAAASFDESLRRHENFLTDWLMQLEHALQPANWATKR